MAVASIPVDLLNPGQVFACVGFLEAADVLLGDAEGGFDWSDEAHVRFLLRAAGEGNPFEAVLTFLAGAKVLSLAPLRSKNRTTQWDVPSKLLGSEAPFPFPDPLSPATLPAIIEGAPFVGSTDVATLTLDHWGDATRRRDAVKFRAALAATQGQPVHATRLISFGTVVVLQSVTRSISLPRRAAAIDSIGAATISQSMSAFH